MNERWSRDYKQRERKKTKIMRRGKDDKLQAGKIIDEGGTGVRESSTREKK